MIVSSQRMHQLIIGSPLLVKAIRRPQICMHFHRILMHHIHHPVDHQVVMHGNQFRFQAICHHHPDQRAIQSIWAQWLPNKILRRIHKWTICKKILDQILLMATITQIWMTIARTDHQMPCNKSLINLRRISCQGEDQMGHLCHF